ncbi:hypothetical protein FK178_13620 [Antarcticibacterium arcticum]|uniref:Addiction module protein n=1 Tax=Antarcticibacterium arcticum TaxID=2585771 RepID=A0A5B8YRF7_9FLAO|nr:addiction module protein [Antarcticibacterium arcticum]QED38689.1 hypothetical protein FK178_13620 [Antarcticibacterium arcticum]
MEAEALKKTVLKYIDEADERLLKILKALIESYLEGEKNQPELYEEDYEEIDRRREAYLGDPEDSYTWDEVKESIRNASKK